MRGPRVAVPKVVPGFPGAAADPQLEALREQTAALREQSAELRKLRLTIRSGIRQVQPACTAVRGICRWGRKWGPWMLASAPGVLVAIGAISPNAAAALKAVFAAWGAPQ